MEVLRPDDAPTFLHLAGPLLGRDEARNQLPLGIAGNLAQHPDVYEVVRYWVVRDRDEPVAAALRTEPHNLVLADPSSGAALEALLQAIVADDPDLPGVVGNVPHVRTAASGLSASTGREAELTLSQGVYGLTTVRELPRVPGRARAATPEDRALVVAWLTAFAHEALPRPEDDVAQIERTVDTRFASERSGLWLWEHERQPVSLAGFSGPTPTGIRVGPVYTPPEHRRRGYATTLVADLSRWLLDQGHRACFLYTDLANPTSNRIYLDIGYERVGDALEYRFRRP
jgi:predicted GNAT family acetyltransferase